MKNYELKKAFKIGSVCIITYMLSYYMRNILSIMTPEMLENGDFGKEFIATMSSVYMIAYAFGQLFSGFIGDVIKTKYMILVGLSLVGAALVYFPAATSAAMCICCFVVLGVGFSMLRGPIVKLASENTLPQYARICCVILSTSYYVGPFIAGILTLFFKWKTVFVISGILAVIIAVVSFSVISLYEKAGLVVPVKIEKKGRYYDGFRSVFKLPNFCVYVVISAVLEVSGTAITFWLPTYVNEYLGFASNVSGIIFSIISLINSFGTFLCLILFKKFGENDMFMIRVMFSLSAVFFVGMCFIHITWINLLLLLFARLANCCASGVMWSIYIPSLAKSGRVSGANGILDCAGYGGAAIATTVFAGTMEKLGWTGTILLWGATALIGAIVTIFGKNSIVQEKVV